MVSIHAPRAGGDFIDFIQARAALAVSIHAPAREATPGRLPAFRNVCVSIHAPAREATPLHRPEAARNVRFNPRPRAGGDPSSRCSLHAYKSFQSTPPRGRRPKSTPACWPTARFNPRPRAGGDCACAKHLHSLQIASHKRDSHQIPQPLGPEIKTATRIYLNPKQLLDSRIFQEFVLA